MIYSKSRDFLFVKGRKVAGTSVEIALSSVCGPEDILTPLTMADELQRLRLYGRGAQNCSLLQSSNKSNSRSITGIAPAAEKTGAHSSLRKFTRVFGCLPTNRIFCVERNPYAKIISSANMAVTKDAYKRGGSRMVAEVNKLKLIITKRLTQNETPLCRNIDLYRDNDGRLPVRVLRFESLVTDFDQLMSEYGITPVPALPHAKKGINSNSIDPRSIFTRQQLDRVNDLFRDEFETFGYEML